MFSIFHSKQILRIAVEFLEGIIRNKRFTVDLIICVDSSFKKKKKEIKIEMRVLCYAHFAVQPICI